MYGHRRQSHPQTHLPSALLLALEYLSVTEEEGVVVKNTHAPPKPPSTFTPTGQRRTMTFRSLSPQLPRLELGPPKLGSEVRPVQYTYTEAFITIFRVQPFHFPGVQPNLCSAAPFQFIPWIFYPRGILAEDTQCSEHGPQLLREPTARPLLFNKPC